MRIKDISIENRPRERFLRQGGAALSDAENLARLAVNSVQKCSGCGGLGYGAAGAIPGRWTRGRGNWNLRKSHILIA